jgi:hypothetical protein
MAELDKGKPLSKKKSWSQSSLAKEASMLVIDSQIHIWQNALPPNPYHRQISSYSYDDALREMDEAGVDSADSSSGTTLGPPGQRPGLSDDEEAVMENSRPRPDTINNLRFAANGAFAMLVGMQLDVFTPMKDGPLTAEQIAAAIDDSRRSPVGAVGFNLNFINHYDAGESYTESEHRDWFTEAGFVDVERANFLLDDGSGLMTARKRF